MHPGIELPMRIKESFLRTGHGPESGTRTARVDFCGSQPEEKDGKIGRDDWIRTSDPLLPKQMRYQTALRPDVNDKGLKYNRNAAHRQRYNGITYTSSSPAAFISAISARRAWPRWLIRFFSSAENSAIVFPKEGT